MIEVYDISKFLPINSGIPDANAYSEHHILHLAKCLENNLHSSAFFHVHSLYMLYVYFQLLRIKRKYDKEFGYALIGFSRDEKHLLEIAKGPFLFSPIKEKEVFRFFRLAGFDDSTISSISNCVNLRNDHLHVNGILNCDTEEKLIKILEIYERNMEVVFEKQKLFVKEIYDDALLRIGDEFDPTNSDDLDLNLITPGLISSQEMEYIKTLNTSHLVTKYLIDNY